MNPALEARRPAAPVPSPNDKRNWDTFYISPLDVYFAHDSVNEHFQPYWDPIQGRRIECKGILDTVRESVQGGIPVALESFDVVWLEDGDGRQGGRWTVAGTFNRRLVVFRLLAIYGYKSKMRVKRVPKEKVKWTLSDGRHKLSTKCYGVWVEVRWGRFVGRSHDPKGEKDPGVRWPEAEALFAKAEQKAPHPVVV